ncbi:MAG: sensor histidine kinase, partial [Nocardioides sp.]
MPIQDRKDQALIRRAVVYFALLSGGLIVLVVAGALVVAETETQRATEFDAEARGRVVFGAVQAGLAASGAASLDAATLDAASSETVEQTAARVGVRAVVLWDPSGTVLWSTRGTLIGRSFALDDEVVELFDRDGRVVADTDVRLDSARPSGLLGNEIEVFAHIEDESGRPLVVEAYVDSASIGPSRTETLQLMLPIGVGAMLLFVGLTLLAGLQLVGRVQASRRERIKLLTTSLIAVDHERRRLAHDLHDGIVQDLAAMRYVLKGVIHVVPDGLPDDPRGRLERVSDVLEEELHSLRSVLRDLVPTETLGSPLPELLATMLERLVRAPVTWSLEVDPEAQTVEPGAANLVRRIVQEGVRNAVHHARPTSVAV